MTQNRSCSLSSKVNRPFYDMVKILVIIISNVNIFTIYKALFENVATILPIIYQNKTKMPGKKLGNAWFSYKWQVLSTIYKVFEHKLTYFDNKVCLTKKRHL